VCACQTEQTKGAFCVSYFANRDPGGRGLGAGETRSPSTGTGRARGVLTLRECLVSCRLCEGGQRSLTSHVQQFMCECCHHRLSLKLQSLKYHIFSYKDPIHTVRNVYYKFIFSNINHIGKTSVIFLYVCAQGLVNEIETPGFTTQ